MNLIERIWWIDLQGRRRCVEGSIRIYRLVSQLSVNFVFSRTSWWTSRQQLGVHLKYDYWRRCVWTFYACLVTMYGSLESIYIFILTVSKNNTNRNLRVFAYSQLWNLKPRSYSLLGWTTIALSVTRCNAVVFVVVCLECVICKRWRIVRAVCCYSQLPVGINRCDNLYYKCSVSNNSFLNKSSMVPRNFQ